MVRGRGGRVVAVIGGNNNQVLVAHRGQHHRQRTVQGQQPGVEAGHVVAVPPALVELDHVGEQEPPRHGAQRALDGAIAGRVPRRVQAGDPAAREEIVDLPHPHPRDVRRHQPVEQRLPRRWNAEILAPVGALPAPHGPHEGARDHPGHPVRTLEQALRDLAGPVQFGEGHHLLVRRELADAVGRGVEDPRPGAAVLLPQLVEDHGPRGGPVAQHPAPRLPRQRLDERRREALRVGPERFRQAEPEQLPVAGGAVLAGPGGARHAAGRARRVHCRHPGERRTAAEPQPLQVR